MGLGRVDLVSFGSSVPLETVIPGTNVAGLVTEVLRDRGMSMGKKLLRFVGLGEVAERSPGERRPGDGREIASCPLSCGASSRISGGDKATIGAGECVWIVVDRVPKVPVVEKRTSI